MARLSLSPQRFHIFSLLFFLVVLGTCIWAIPHTQNLHEFASTVADVTVTINTTQPAGISNLNVGTTNTFDGIGIKTYNTTYLTNAENLLKNAAIFENRHIYGWGLGNPEPTNGNFNWTDLDKAMQELEREGGTPVLTLCCSPGWMTAAGTTTDTQPNLQPPTSAHYTDFATLTRAVVNRYSVINMTTGLNSIGTTPVKYYQVWNEENTKGFGTDGAGYTTFYNTLYDAIKAIDPSLKVGGPYVSIPGSFITGAAPDSAPIPAWMMSQIIVPWNAEKHGADFFALDYSIVDQNADYVPWPPPLDQILAKTSNFESIMTQLRQNGITLPVWWSEDYCDVNLDRLSYMQSNFQGACLASVLYHELTSGAATSLRWAPGADAYDALGNENKESLFTDISQPVGSTELGGIPYPAYYAYQYFHQYFSPGTQLYTTTSTDPTIEVLASATKTLLINKNAIQKIISVNGTTTTLAPYQIALIDTPVSTSTFLFPHVYLHGVGSAGDNVFPSPPVTPQASSTLQHPARNVQLELYLSQTDTTPFATINGSLTYQPATGDFGGSIIWSNPTPGNYYLKFITSRYLHTSIPNVQTVTFNQTTTLPSFGVVVGDVDGDNAVTISDYNIILDCGEFDSNPLPLSNPNSHLYSSSCQSYLSHQVSVSNADLDDNNYIDQFDMTLLQREMSVQRGQ